jgi:hypothetical protein
VDGCRALADVLSLQKAPGLLTLNLNYNLEVGDAGVSALVDGLFNNSALKVRRPSLSADPSLILTASSAAIAPRLLRRRPGRVHQAGAADKLADLRR